MSQALLVMSLTLLVAELLACDGLRELRAALQGKRGYELATIAYRLALMMTLSQALLAAAAFSLVAGGMMLAVHPAMFLVVEILQAFAVLYAFLRVHKLVDQHRGDE